MDQVIISQTDGWLFDFFPRSVLSCWVRCRAPAFFLIGSLVCDSRNKLYYGMHLAWYCFQKPKEHAVLKHLCGSIAAFMFFFFQDLVLMMVGLFFFQWGQVLDCMST